MEMIKTKKEQEGMTILSLLMVLAIAGVFLTAAFKIGPLYLDNYFVRSSMEPLQTEILSEMSDGQIRQKVDSNFNINNVRNITSKDLKIKRDKQSVLLSLNYEKRVEYLGNLDLVVKFTNELRINN